VLNLAARDGLIARNPANGVGRLIARVARREDSEVAIVDAWTRREAEALLAVAEEHEARFAPLLRFLLSTGARRAQKLGVRPLKLHAARHTFATLALEAGRSLRFVAEPLGHANPALTLRVHAHAVPVEGGDLEFADFGSTQDPSARSTEPTGDVSGSGSGFRTRQRPRRHCAGALQECWSTRRDLNPRPSRWQGARRARNPPKRKENAAEGEKWVLRWRMS